MTTEENYLAFVKKQFRSYKDIAEKGIAQVPQSSLFYQSSKESESLSILKNRRLSIHTL